MTESSIRHVFVLGIDEPNVLSGNFGYHGSRKLVEAVKSLGVIEQLGGIGLVTTDTDLLDPTAFPLPEKVVWLTSTPEQVTDALTAHKTRIKQSSGTTLPGGMIILIMDLLAAHTIERMVLLAKQHLPHHEIALLVKHPDPDQWISEEQQHMIQDICEQLMRLQSNHLATSLLYDARSSLGLSVGPDLQDEVVIKTLASLLFLSGQDQFNPSVAQVLDRLRSLASLTSLSCTSAKIAAGKAKRTWTFMRRLFPDWPERGEGNLTDAMTQSKTLIRAMLDQHAGMATHIPPDVSLPLFVLCLVPFRAADPRFGAYSNEIRRFLALEYPQSVGIITSGNGVPLRHLGAGYYVQCSLLYPLSPARFLLAGKPGQLEA